MIITVIGVLIVSNVVWCYDPNDESLKEILPAVGQFEAFYLNEKNANAARPPHLHGSFHNYRNPALIGAKNSAAYGYRFDGKRRFEYDQY